MVVGMGAREGGGDGELGVLCKRGVGVHFLFRGVLLYRFAYLFVGCTSTAGIVDYTS